MTDEMHDLLKRSWRGNSVIEYINSLEKEKECLQTENKDLRIEAILRKSDLNSATAELEEAKKEIEQLKQVIDADSKYVCENKPMCRKG